MADKKVGKKTNKKVEQPKKNSFKTLLKKWWFWVAVGGGVVVIAAAVVLSIIFFNNLNNKKVSLDPASKNDGNWIATCKPGSKDLISGGKWVVGKDVASGDYKLTSDDYFYAYIYESENADDYLKTISLSKDGSATYVHLSNGQMIKVSSNSVNMECQDFGDLALVSSEADLKAGGFTVVSVDKYFYAYLYDHKGARDYDTTISISKIGEDKAMRFKDGQYLKVSSGNAFLIDMSLDNADALVEKAKDLAKKLSTGKEEKTETSSSTTSSSSSSSASSTSSSTTSSSSSSSSAEWKKLLKEYEAWVDKYVAFMKKYKNADSSQLSSMMSDYSSMMSDLSSWSSKISSLKGSLSGSDLTEYSKTLTRITEKMNSVQ